MEGVKAAVDSSRESCHPHFRATYTNSVQINIGFVAEGASATKPRETLTTLPPELFGVAKAARRQRRRTGCIQTLHKVPVIPEYSWIPATNETRSAHFSLGSLPHGDESLPMLYLGPLRPSNLVTSSQCLLHPRQDDDTGLLSHLGHFALPDLFKP